MWQIGLRQRGYEAAMLKSRQNDGGAAGDDKCDSQGSRQPRAAGRLQALRLKRKEANEQTETRHDKAKRNEREARAEPRKKSALSGEKHPRIGVGHGRCFVLPNVRHERRAKGREAAFGTSARWSG
jgi:hypothetical protein